MQFKHQLVDFLNDTFVTCGDERGPFRLALLICSEDALFFAAWIPCLTGWPSAFFLLSGILLLGKSQVIHSHPHGHYLARKKPRL